MSQTKKRHTIHNMMDDILSIIFPQTCIHCGEPLVGEEKDLCTHCLCQLEWFYCSSTKNNEVERRLMGRIPIEAATTLLLFRKGNVTQNIIHQIKYHGNIHLAKEFGMMLGNELTRCGRFNDIDIIVPVPLHWWRKHKRGYNQSELICHSLSQKLDCPVVTNNLYRKHYTKSQTRKDRQQRRTNMNNAFSVRHPERFESKHILLIDDVITTGSTMEACYHAIETIPNIRVSIASLALTIQ